MIVAVAYYSASLYRFEVHINRTLFFWPIGNMLARCLQTSDLNHVAYQLMGMDRRDPQEAKRLWGLLWVNFCNYLLA
jgi:hypothetical protein